MPLTLSVVGGDGISGSGVRMNIALPDAGVVATVQGVYVPPSIGQPQPGGQQAPVNFMGSQSQTYTNGGYWGIQMNTTTGALSNLFTGGVPTASAGNILLAYQLMPATTTLSTQGGWVFPCLASVNPL